MRKWVLFVRNEKNNHFLERYMRDLFILSCVFAYTTNLFAFKDFKLSKDVFKKVSFESKIGDVNNYYGTYLQMNVNFKPVKDLFYQLDEFLADSLNKTNARTEAHITVLTPIEYQNFFKPLNISMNEINHVALDYKIQKSDYKILCIGKGESDTRTEATYYLVVESKNLLKIRKELYELYLIKGGIPSRFDPESFYPHITIGYSAARDLHLADGVHKGRNSCWSNITLK